MCSPTAARQPFAPHELTKLMTIYQDARDHFERQLLWLLGYALQYSPLLRGTTALGQENMAAITAALRRLLALLEGDLWHAHALPTPPASRETVDLASLLESLARETHAISTSHVSLRATGDAPCIQANTSEDLCRITADPQALRRVLENLLANALSHGRAQTIRLSAQADGPQHVAIHVEDFAATLPGQSATTLAHAPPTDWRPATGFGMRICNRLVRAHGGTLQIRNQPAVGTRVTLRLPTGDRSASQSTDANLPPSAPGQPTWIAQVDAIAEAGHDLRSPLSAVIGFCQLMLQEVDDAPDASSWEALRIIEQQTRCLLQLANQLLESARLATGRLRLARYQLSAKDLMQRAAASLSTTGQDPIPVHIDAQPAHLVLTGDCERLGDALAYLLIEELSQLKANGLRMLVHPWDTHSGRASALQDDADSLRIHLLASGEQRAQSDLSSIHARETETDRITRRLGSMLARGYVACHGGSIKHEITPGGRTCTVTLSGRGQTTRN